MIEPVGVLHGRFQPLHLGHLEYLLAGARACETLVVGITNPDPWNITFEPTDPARGRAAANPCTYYERVLMVEGALADSGVSRSRMRIVPFPHGMPERLFYYAPRDALYFLTIYDVWGEEKLRRFHALGLHTCTLWRRAEKFTTGSEIRRRIRANEQWNGLVPPAVAGVIAERGIAERIRGVDG